MQLNVIDNMYNKCTQCCNQKIIDDYNQIKETYNDLKKELNEDFINHIEEWFKKHPYVDEICITNDSLYSPEHLLIRKNTRLKTRILFI